MCAAEILKSIPYEGASYFWHPVDVREISEHDENFGIPILRAASSELDRMILGHP